MIADDPVLGHNARTLDAVEVVDNLRLIVDGFGFAAPDHSQPWFPTASLVGADPVVRISLMMLMSQSLDCWNDPVVKL